MAVEEIEAVEAVPRQGIHHVLDDGDQRRGTQRHRAGKRHVVLGHADIQRRRDHRAGLLADAARNGLGANGVGPDQAVRPVLLGRADGDDDAALALEVLFDLLPCAELKEHSAMIS
jgi:hypothetical protein